MTGDKLTRETVQSIRRSARWNASFNDAITPHIESKTLAALCDLALSALAPPPITDEEVASLLKDGRALLSEHRGRTYSTGQVPLDLADFFERNGKTMLDLIDRLSRERAEAREALAALKKEYIKLNAQCSDRIGDLLTEIEALKSGGGA